MGDPIPPPEPLAREAPKGASYLHVSDLAREIGRATTGYSDGTRVNPLLRIYGREIREVSRLDNRTGNPYIVKFIAPTDDPRSNSYVDCMVRRAFPHVVAVDVLDKDGSYIDERLELTDQNVAPYRSRPIRRTVEDVVRNLET